MKYLLLLVISLFSVTVSSAKNNVVEKSGSILDLRNNKVVFINGNDTIRSIKKGNIFYFPFSEDIVINKVLLPDTAKASHSFKVTSNGKLIGEESQDKKSHDQNIQVLLYNVYTIYWGGINWKICCSDEFSRKFDLILLDTKQISIKDNTGDKIEDIDDNGFFELNDTVTINSVQFPTAGLLTVKCNGDVLLEKSVRKIEDNFGLILYKGNSYIFSLGDKSWNIGAKEEASTSTDISSWLIGVILGIVLSTIAFVLFKKRQLIKKMFVRYNKLTTNERIIKYKSKDGNICIGAAAFPDGFYTLADGRSILINKEIIELIFPAESFKQTDRDSKDLIINCEEDNPQRGDAAFPDGFFSLNNGTQIIVEGRIVKEIIKVNVQNKSEEDLSEGGTMQTIEKVSTEWYDTLTDATRQQLESIELSLNDYSSFDELCSSMAMSLLHQKNSLEEIAKSEPAKGTTQQRLEYDVINGLVATMSHKRTIKEAIENLGNKVKDVKIETKDQLIDLIEKLLTPRTNSDAYTLEQLEKIARWTQLSAITKELKDNVFDVYTKRYITTMLELGNKSNTILAEAAKNQGYVIFKSEDLNKKALDIIGRLVTLNFTSLDAFKDTWDDLIKKQSAKTSHVDVDSEVNLYERLKNITGSEKLTVSDILDELEKNTTTHKPDEIDINGRSVDEIKQELEEYEKLKPLSELTQFGTTVETIKEELSYIGVRKGQIELATAIKKAVSEAVPDIQVVEPFGNLKKIVEGIHKADSAEKMANAIGRISTLAEEMSSLQEEKANALDEKENALKEKNEANALITNEVKTHYRNLFNKDLSSDDSINAIDLFGEQVKETVSSLNQKIIEKDGIISNKNDEIANQKQINSEKDEEIRTLCEDYSNIIFTAFEQIEKNLNSAYKYAKSSDALPNKFIQRVIQNDAFNVTDFMDELRKIVKSPSSAHKDIIRSLHNLFLDTVQSNSWVQTLSHIYLYVQNSEVASYFTRNKIDVGCINSSFILTEQMMRALGIELHYPKLFEDIFDSNLYDESTLSDVKDYVNDVKELVGNRQGVIIDMFRLGYTSDGQTHKAKVTRFN